MNDSRTDSAKRSTAVADRQHGRHSVDLRSRGVSLMTSKEAAERLCMSHEWLRKKVQRREVPFVRLGRYVRFTEAHLVEIIDSATQPGGRLQGRGSARTKL